MLAAQISRFGGPDVVAINEVPTPVPADGEVLVAVEAASVNGHDTIVRSGGLKFVSGRRFPIGLGLDFAGTVTAVGPGVSAFRVGQEVWGMVDPKGKHATAAAAQCVVVAQARLGAAPGVLSSTEAASLVVAGTTALIALRDVLRVRSGQRVLIRGAAGGVGSAAVQIAHALGAHVTALAGAGAAEALRRLGADVVLDRATSRPRGAGRFDAVLDLAGTDLAPWRRTLTRGGRMVTVAISGPALVAIGLSTVHGGGRIHTFSADPDTAVLDALAELVETGAVKPVVASVRPLAALADAHRAFEPGGVAGKHVVLIGRGGSAA